MKEVFLVIAVMLLSKACVAIFDYLEEPIGAKNFRLAASTKSVYQEQSDDQDDADSLTVMP